MWHPSLRGIGGLRMCCQEPLVRIAALAALQVLYDSEENFAVRDWPPTSNPHLC